MTDAVNVAPVSLAIVVASSSVLPSTGVHLAGLCLRQPGRWGELP